jgi:hypothetical protein
MRSWLVYVWRGPSNVAVISTTDEKFLNAFKRWIEWQDDYKISIRESKLGPEHQ